jgi:hypothetical protein
MDASERRRNTRYPLRMPTRIQTKADDEGFGVTRNVSSTGALLGTLRPLSIGDSAELSFELETADARSVMAAVVRLEVSPPHVAGLFRYLVAVCFEQPLPASLLTNVASNKDYVPED